MDADVQKRYRESLAQMPVCPEDDAATARRREIALSLIHILFFN